MRRNRWGRTADRILDVAEGLVQVRGYNAFSYADVADTLGIQKASLHHHYATKAELGVALVERYRRTFLDALSAIEADCDSASERLERYVGLYAAVLRRGRMCMCGMLAADVATLPRAVREGIVKFFVANEAWLAHVLETGKKRGELRFEGTPSSTAAFFVSSLEGAMLVVRVNGHLEHFDDVARQLLGRILPATQPKRSHRAR